MLVRNFVLFKKKYWNALIHDFIIFRSRQCINEVFFYKHSTIFLNLFLCSGCFIKRILDTCNYDTYRIFVVYLRFSHRV